MKIHQIVHKTTNAQISAKREKNMKMIVFVFAFNGWVLLLYFIGWGIKHSFLAGSDPISNLIGNDLGIYIAMSFGVGMLWLWFAQKIWGYFRSPEQQ